MSGSCASRRTVVVAGDLFTAPLSGSRSPDSTLSSVDLPTPFGAMIPVRSPAPMLRLTPSSTTRLPKDTLTLVAVSLDIAYSQDHGPAARQGRALCPGDARGGGSSL